MICRQPAGVTEARARRHAHVRHRALRRGRGGASRAPSELTVVGLSTAAALVVLRLVNTQIYTEPGTIDPWLYTALMTNFDFIYDHFSTTYYASRLPAILPGYFLNSFLTPQQAYVVLHLVFFLAGALFLYLLVRTLFGVRVAVLLYPAFLTNAMYVDAHTWDYVDGFVITYLSGGLYFLASCTGRRSRVRPALAGLLLRRGRGHEPVRDADRARRHRGVPLRAL